MADTHIDRLNQVDSRRLFRQARRDLVEKLAAQGITNPQVLETIEKTPRHSFLDGTISKMSYDNVSLPIGYEQTISQPYVVARMTELLLENRKLDSRPDKVLEIGTGSGYQTAVLAALIPRVFTIERIQALSQRARQRLRDIGVQNVHFRYGDGSRGWAKFAPFDSIMITAAADEVPQTLIDQLGEGGCLVAPLGGREVQQLTVIERDAHGLRRNRFDFVKFVPLI